MITVRAICPKCGEITVPGDAVTLYIDHHHKPSTGFYAFQCPTCRTQIRRPADAACRYLLIANGIRPQPWTSSPEPTPDGLPLTADDLLDLCIALNTHDHLAVAAEAGA